MKRDVHIKDAKDIMVAFLAYDWQASNNKRSQEHIALAGTGTEPPIVGNGSPTRQGGWIWIRKSVQMELRDPTPGTTYCIKVHLRDDPVNEDGSPGSEGFHITAWYQPNAPVSLQNSELKLDYQKDYFFEREDGAECGGAHSGGKCPTPKDCNRACFQDANNFR